MKLVEGKKNGVTHFHEDLTGHSLMSGLIIGIATPHTMQGIYIFCSKKCTYKSQHIWSACNFHGQVNYVHLDKTVCHDFKGVGDVLYQVECPNFSVT